MAPGGPGISLGTGHYPPAYLARDGRIYRISGPDSPRLSASALGAGAAGALREAWAGVERERIATRPALSEIWRLEGGPVAALAAVRLCRERTLTYASLYTRASDGKNVKHAMWSVIKPDGSCHECPGPACLHRDLAAEVELDSDITEEFLGPALSERLNQPGRASAVVRATHMAHPEIRLYRRQTGTSGNVSLELEFHGMHFTMALMDANGCSTSNYTREACAKRSCAHQRVSDKLAEEL